MVCDRCKMIVKSVLDKNELEYEMIDLGEVSLKESISEGDRMKIERELSDLGFELINDKKSRLITQVKTQIINLIYQSGNDTKLNLSDFLNSKLNYDYNYISNIFSEVEGTTIEKYFIAQKIERVKELLVYDELTLSEIAFQLNYSSTAYLSSQFKKITGLTPSHFKAIKDNKRKSIDKV